MTPVARLKELAGGMLDAALEYAGLCHIEELREATQDASAMRHLAALLELVAERSRYIERLEHKLSEVAALLEWSGCNCECGCDSDGHDDDCDRCLACRIYKAVR